MILIPVVAAIWGYAVYKYFFWSESESETVEVVAPSTTNEASINQDSERKFTINGGYRDPFLGKSEPKVRADVEVTSFVENVPIDKPAPAPPPVPVATIPTIDWSIVRYNGYVQNTVGESMDGLLSVSGRIYHVNQGAVVKGIEVLAMNADSIRLKFAGESKTIAKR